VKWFVCVWDDAPLITLEGHHGHHRHLVSNGRQRINPSMYVGQAEVQMFILGSLCEKWRGLDLQKVSILGVFLTPKGF